MRPWPRVTLRVLEHLVLAAVLAGLGLLATAGFWMQASDTPVACDVMVVLGGDFERPAYAAELYRLGMAPRVYVGRTYRKPGERVLDASHVPYPLEEEVYKALLRKKGVPAQAIDYYGDDLMSTAQEAEAMAAQLGPGPGKLLVVTSPYHVRRARMVFTDALPGWDVRVCGAPSQTLPAAWWTRQASARIVLMELPKTLYYLAGGRFRSTSELSPQVAPATPAAAP